MKNQKGITLVSLVIYIVVMIILLVIMSLITTEFYKNTNNMQGNVQEVLEFNKFNNYFLKEVKANDNKIDTVSNNYILFSSGNSFLLNSNSIYYNNTEICTGVQTLKFELQSDSKGEKTIIKVSLSFKNFNKTMRYKLENIY